MQVLGLVFLTFSVVAAQYPPRFRNPGFRNVRTPLITSASKERPFISIPIVLLPDGQAIPKPRQTNYQFVGNAPRQVITRQSNQRNLKPRGTLISKPAANYQVVVPPPVPLQQAKKQPKLPKQTQQNFPTPLSNGPMRNVQQNIPKPQRGIIPKLQQNQPQKQPVQQQYQPTQEMPQQQFLKQQRIPALQQQLPTNQQVTSAYKQNVANFVNFAANLGASIASQQAQLQQNIQTTDAPPVSGSYQNSQPQKFQENFVSLRGSSSGNPRFNNGVNYNIQVQSSTPNVPHHQPVQIPYEQQIVQNNPQVQLNSYNFAQQQPTQHHQSLANAQYAQVGNSKQTLQGANSQPNVQYQANAYQQSTGTNLRFPAAQNSALQSNSFSTAPQQTVQQTYASVTSQQANPASQLLDNYDSQSQITKSSINVAPQTGLPGYILNTQSLQSNYASQNQDGQSSFILNPQGPQISFANSAQTIPSTVTFPSSQSVQAASLALQTGQSSSTPQNDQTGYLQYQNAQDLQVNYAAALNTAQGNYNGASQAIQQSEPSQQAVENSYTIVPNNQNSYSSNAGQSVYAAQQQAVSSSNTPSVEANVQSYDPYSSIQSSASTEQQDETSYGSAQQNDNKDYPSSQYSYLLQNTQSTLSSQSSENQQTQNDSPVGSGQLIYASSAVKQSNYPTAAQAYSTLPQQYSSPHLQSSPTYVSFTTTSNFKSDQVPQTSGNYGLRSTGVVTPGTTYGKLIQSNAKQTDASSQQQAENSDEEYEEEEEGEDEEASYKVVYIPLDILKNILSNSVENHQ